MKVNGIVIASTVAAMLLAAGCSSGEKTGQQSQGVKCQGGNECKGKSECAGKDGGNSCQGMNDCKGQGWTTYPDAKACTDKGGKVIT